MFASSSAVALVALVASLAALGPPGCDAFAPRGASPAAARRTFLAAAVPSGADEEATPLGARGRRSALASLLAASSSSPFLLLLPDAASAEAETMERGGVQLTPFNSLAFNYRGGGSPTIDASSLDEPSISYAEFLDKLNSDEVAFVEFLAPNGDAAYATLKSSSGTTEGTTEGKTETPVRIGEGYPVEDPEGWSSPAFVIKAVAKKGVPYKFVVPGLGDSFRL
ncbi:hypothetical protein ACHAWF_001864 [Thalassiosira exigua]